MTSSPAPDPDSRPCGAAAESERSSSARDRLVEAAAALMRDEGYPHVSVDAILGASGVSRSNFYYHFPSKDDLVLAVVDAWQAELAETLVRPILEDASLTPLGRVRCILGQMVERMRETDCRAGCPFGALASSEAEHNDAFREKLVAVFEGFRELFAGLFAAARQAGETRSDAPSPEDLATATLAVVQGGLLLSKTYGDPEQLRRAADALMALSVRCN